MPAMKEKGRRQKVKLNTKASLLKCGFCLTFTFYLFTLSFPRAVLAHEGRPHNFHDLWRAWSWEPVVLVCLALSAWLYFWGVRKLWRNDGVGRGVDRWEVACYALGWLSLMLALVSPLHSWGRVLFSAHMTQH